MADFQQITKKLKCKEKILDTFAFMLYDSKGVHCNMWKSRQKRHGKDIQTGTPL